MERISVDIGPNLIEQISDTVPRLTVIVRPVRQGVAIGPPTMRIEYVEGLAEHTIVEVAHDVDSDDAQEVARYTEQELRQAASVFGQNID